MMLSNVGLVAFHYKSYGTFLILKKPYNSTVELPTTEIIEPFFYGLCDLSNEMKREMIYLFESHS